VRVQPRNFDEEERPSDGGPECFDTAAALELNRARLEHFELLELPWAGKSVLDVGCGVGHLSQALARKKCRVVGVDAREENIRVFRQRHPRLQAHVANVESDLSSLGSFDIVLCCGLLYHVENPFQALRNLSAVCRELLIVETIVCDHELPVAVWDDETKSANQAMQGLGCRPSPSLVTLALNRIGFPLVYAPLRPPNHPEFDVRWTNSLAWIQDGHVIRSVFLASRAPMDNPALTLLCGAVPSWYCQNFGPGEEIPGAVSIAEPALHNSSQISRQEPLTLVSPPQPWAYCVAFRLHQQRLRESRHRGPIVIKADLNVQAGQVRCAGITADFTALVGEEAALSAGQGRQAVEIGVEAPERCGWIVFRNGAANGPSRFEIRGLTAYQARERARNPGPTGSAAI
jgi:SAM-dependent methyltransferase